MTLDHLHFRVLFIALAASVFLLHAQEPVCREIGFGEINSGSLLQDVSDHAGGAQPSRDLDRRERIRDGNGDGDARIDLGAYEFPPQVLPRRSRTSNVEEP